MRGSSASIRTSRSACGSATTRRSRSDSNETGAQAALPIWIDFMKAYIDTRADRKNVPQFEAPGNIVFVTLDYGHQRSVHQRHPAAGRHRCSAASPEPRPASGPRTHRPSKHGVTEKYCFCVSVPLWPVIRGTATARRVLAPGPPKPREGGSPARTRTRARSAAARCRPSP